MSAKDDLNADEFRAALAAEIKTEGGVTAWASKRKVSGASVSLTALGRRGPQPSVVLAAGYQAVTVYRRLPG